MNSNRQQPTAQVLVQGQPSWRLTSPDVEAFVTEKGGHLGPVTFDRRGGKFQPYSVAPWATEPMEASLPPILHALRGDFFCLPFGGNATPYRREKHPVHGQTANARWRFRSLVAEAGQACLSLWLRTTIRPGQVDKCITLRDGQNIVYCEHTVSGMSGPMTVGHHAMLKFPDAPGSGRVSTSRFVYGQVFPGDFEQPEHRGYSALKAGAVFSSLERVPTRDGATADLTSYPARRGFEDLILLVADARLPLAWTAVVFPEQRYVWFALKDPRRLRHTIFWISNGGRHYPPWNGRHVNVLGLEEVTAYFHLGLAESARRNPLSEKGYATCFQLNPKQPLRIPYLMGVAKVPAGFDRVAVIEPAADDQAVTLHAASGQHATATVDLAFLRDPPRM